ncbi:hypothetical protein [Streptomyces sp. TLI_146]|uniref:hypothetical protein n=1 Tax=Streptomyces sp. TLI_146 TaxID=1938858 RepID=UPI000C7132AE|nr:hypothetical protein [Streptomyces sp. TLI_146]PKV89056.1 hypothetical protein BX283_6688 [Streptomyces sp. TLI_146]
MIFAVRIPPLVPFLAVPAARRLADSLPPGPAAPLHPALRPLRAPLEYALERCADEAAASAVGDRGLAARAIGRAALASRPPRARTDPSGHAVAPQRPSNAEARRPPPRRVDPVRP